jgi:hypothetical protein
MILTEIYLSGNMIVIFPWHMTGQDQSDYALHKIIKLRYNHFICHSLIRLEKTDLG